MTLTSGLPRHQNRPSLPEITVTTHADGPHQAELTGSGTMADDRQRRKQVAADLPPASENTPEESPFLRRFRRSFAG